MAKRLCAYDWEPRSTRGLRACGATIGVIILISALTGCEPTVKVAVPDKPIVMKIDLNVKHEVKLQVENELERSGTNPAVPLAKRAGWIGERGDGYLGLVKDDAPQTVKDIVLEANETRQRRYAALADKHDVAVSMVEQVAGSRLVERSLPGEYVLDDAGRWKQI